MVETYTVEATLNWKTNVPEVLRQLTRGFEDIDRLIKGTQSNLGKLASEIKELSGNNRGIGALARALEKVKIPDSTLSGLREMGTLTRNLAEAQANVARDAMASAKAFRDMAQASRQSSGGGGRGHRSHASMLDAAMGAQMVGDAGTGFFEKAFMASADASHLMTQFQQNTSVTPGDLAKIRAKADALTQAVPGTTITENLHTILDAYTITGQIGEALNASGGMAKLSLLYQSLPSSHRGDPAYAAGQAIEVMQRFYDPKTHQVDMGAFNAQLAAMAKVAVGTGGRVSGDAYLSFAKQARMGGMLASDEFLYGDLPALMISLGGSRAGTGDAATYRQFVQGKMTKGAYSQLQHFGLVDRGAGWSHGQVQDMTKHLAGAEEFLTNPAAWVRDVLIPQLGRKGVNINDRASVGTNIGQWASTSTGLGFLLELALGMPGLMKEKGKIAGVNADPMSVVNATDPMQKLREFHAAETNLMTTLGDTAMGPALEALKGLTNALRQMMDTVKDHPTAAKDIMLIGGGMALLAKVAGDAAMTIFVGAPLVKGLGSLAKAVLPFSAGGAGETALATLAGPLGLGEITLLLGGLALAVTGLPPLLKAATDMLPSGVPGANLRSPTHAGGVAGKGSPWSQYLGGGGGTSQDWSSYLWGGTPHAGANMRSGTPIVNNVYIDGKKVAGALMGSSGVQRGTTGFDGTRSLMPAGIPQGTGN